MTEDRDTGLPPALPAGPRPAAPAHFHRPLATGRGPAQRVAPGRGAEGQPGAPCARRWTTWPHRTSSSGARAEGPFVAAHSADRSLFHFLPPRPATTGERKLPSSRMLDCRRGMAGRGGGGAPRARAPARPGAADRPAAADPGPAGDHRADRGAAGPVPPASTGRITGRCRTRSTTSTSGNTASTIGSAAAEQLKAVGASPEDAELLHLRTGAPAAGDRPAGPRPRWPAGSNGACRAVSRSTCTTRPNWRNARSPGRCPPCPGTTIPGKDSYPLKSSREGGELHGQRALPRRPCPGRCLPCAGTTRFSRVPALRRPRPIFVPRRARRRGPQSFCLICLFIRPSIFFDGRPRGAIASTRSATGPRPIAAAKTTRRRPPSTGPEWPATGGTAMGSVQPAQGREAVRRPAGDSRCRPGDRRGGVRRLRRAVGLREVDAAAHDRRAGKHLRRRDPHRRPQGQRHAAARPEHRDGVPGLTRSTPISACSENIGVRAAPCAAVPDDEVRQRVMEAAKILNDRTAAGAQAARAVGAASASALPWAGRSSATRSPFLFDEPLSNLDAKLRTEMRHRDQAAARASCGRR